MYKPHTHTFPNLNWMLVHIHILQQFLQVYSTLQCVQYFHVYETTMCLQYFICLKHMQSSWKKKNIHTHSERAKCQHVDCVRAARCNRRQYILIYMCVYAVEGVRGRIKPYYVYKTITQIPHTPYIRLRLPCLTHNLIHIQFFFYNVKRTHT